MQLSTAIYFLILCILLYSDITNLTIPNIIVLPSILIGVVITGYWDYALLMFLVGSLIFSRGGFCGGDVKLMAMVGAYTGFYSIFILSLAISFTVIYYINKPTNQPRPFTPFVLAPSFLFFWI